MRASCKVVGVLSLYGQQRSERVSGRAEGGSASSDFADNFRAKRSKRLLSPACSTSDEEDC